MVGTTRECLNVFYFEVVTMTLPQALSAIVDDITTWYFETFLAPTLAMQSNQLEHLRLEVNNLMDFEGDYCLCVPDAPVAGSNAGEYLAPSTAWSFKLNRGSRLTRNGSKRLAAVPEGLGANNIPSSSARILAADVGAMWEGTIVVPWGAESDHMDLSMRIPKTPTVGTLPTVFNTVTTVEFRGMGTQSSRKQLRPS